MAEGGAAPPPGGTPSPATLARHSRFLGQQYADITKLREIAARHDRAASRVHQRISRLNTRIEKLRHQATILRERAEKALARVPTLEAEIARRAASVQPTTDESPTGRPRSDVTAEQYRIRKIQQRISDLHQRARSLELKAAQKTQRTSELKVRSDQLLESARLSEQEAAQHRQRADRLQLLTEQETNAPVGSPSGAPTSTPPPPSA